MKYIKNKIRRANISSARKSPLLPKVVSLFTNNLRKRAPYPVPTSAILRRQMVIMKNQRPISHSRTPNRISLRPIPIYAKTVTSTSRPFQGYDVGHRRVTVRREMDRDDLKRMNWEQAKAARPKLRPFGDADGDGVLNIWDCRPFNKNKQGEMHGQEESAQDLIDDEGYKPVKIGKTNFMLPDDKNFSKAKQELISAHKEFYGDEDKESKEEQEDWDDQIGYDDKKASANITKITKEYKNKPFPK